MEANLSISVKWYNETKVSCLSFKQLLFQRYALLDTIHIKWEAPRGGAISILAVWQVLFSGAKPIAYAASAEFIRYIYWITSERLRFERHLVIYSGSFPLLADRTAEIANISCRVNSDNKIRTPSNWQVDWPCGCKLRRIRALDHITTMRRITEIHRNWSDVLNSFISLILVINLPAPFSNCCDWHSY